MKKILFVLLISLFVSGCSKNENLSEKLIKCMNIAKTEGGDAVREICGEVVKINKKSVAADMAISLIGMTYGEEEFIKNADRYAKFPGAYVAIGDHFFERKEFDKAKYWYRNGAKYDIDKINKNSLEEDLSQKIQEIFSKDILEAQTKLGIMLLPSENEKEKKEGLMWLEKAATHPYDKALYTLGLHYFIGIDVKQDYERSFKYLIASSTLGNVEAMFLLGIMSFTGIGARESDFLAFKAWNNAYERNHPGAKLLLEYDDLAFYVAKMTLLKMKTTNNKTIKDIYYFNNWLESDEAKQFLHKKQISAEEIEKNMAWMTDYAEYGLDFAISYLRLDKEIKEKRKSKV